MFVKVRKKKKQRHIYDSAIAMCVKGSAVCDSAQTKIADKFFEWTDKAKLYNDFRCSRTMLS